MSSTSSPLGMLQAGTVHLLCLTASSGVPLFSRGSSKQLPFSVIGSLNGVHMFGAGHTAALSWSETQQGGRVLWRVFHDSLMLIAVSNHADISELHLRHLLENTWNCMVLVLGLDVLTNTRNVERLKRELRSCYRLMDMLVERCRTNRHPKGLMGDLTHCADCILVPQPIVLQEALDAFVSSAESEFGCLLINDRLALATEKWWRLAPQELVLLASLASLRPELTSCDYPVFLPQGSPNVPHRLLCFQLLPGAVACILCGPKPSLYHVEGQLVARFWAPLVENLQCCLEQAERSTLPSSVKLPQDIQAVLLINRESRRSLTTATTTYPKACCWEPLRLFYTFTMTRYFTSEEVSPSGGSPTSQPLHEKFSDGFSHQPTHCYLVTESWKCYAMQTPQHQIFLIANLSIPTFALRSITTRTLNAVTMATGL